MKIAGVPKPQAFLNQVREKRDSEGGESRQDGGSGGQSPQQEASDQEPSDETIDAAIQAFTKDPQTKAAGLEAIRAGQGPGLKIVLKNSLGSVVRQFSGEEFIKLREATAKGGPSGKILDRKL